MIGVIFAPIAMFVICRIHGRCDKRPSRTKWRSWQEQPAEEGVLGDEATGVWGAVLAEPAQVADGLDAAMRRLAARAVAASGRIGVGAGYRLSNDCPKSASGHCRFIGGLGGWLKNGANRASSKT